MQHETKTQVNQSKVHPHDTRPTLGIEDPANPALIVAVPLSMTTGWLNRSGPPPVSSLMLLLLLQYR